MHDLDTQSLWHLNNGTRSSYGRVHQSELLRLNPMTAYNPLERPRAVVAGCPEDHAVVRAVRELAGWCSVAPMGEQPLQDRDMVVVWQDATDGTSKGLNLGGYAETHLRVIQFGGKPEVVPGLVELEVAVPPLETCLW